MESIFDILYIPMGYILRFAYSLTDNYLWSICLFTLVMEVILIPFVIKQQKNQIKQAKLSPKTAAIRKKYAGRNDQATQQKMQQEIMDMYQKENFNPASGCGTLLIQMPIIICLYNVVTQPLRYLCNVPTAQVTALQEFLVGQGVELNARNLQIDIINHIRDSVADYYTIAPALEGALIPEFTVGPFDLSQIPSISFSPFDWLMLIPVITFVVQILSMKITRKFTYQDPTAGEVQNSMSMKIMEWSMPLMFVYIEFQMSAAICVYWLFRNIISTVIRIIVAVVMPTPKYTEEDYKAAEKEIGVKEKHRKSEAKENKQFVRSLHYIDDEEYLERHAEDLKALEEGKKTVKSSEIGDTTKGKATKEGAPAPIKNDDKSSYQQKKD